MHVGHIFLRNWYILILSISVLIVIIGGTTRLTNSGLSMTTWKPITGILPPISDSQWIQEFEEYKKYPEFNKINHSMTLAEFKYIFFWEYFHRLMGRFLGLAIIIPYLFLSFKNMLHPYDKKNILVMILLVIIQGGVGWYMVKSGLIDNPDVSHFRLALHLLMAFIFMGFVLWHILDLYKIKEQNKYKSSSAVLFSYLFFGFLLLQICYGAFSAGLNSGIGYNTFPLMNGNFLPIDIFTNNNILYSLLNDRYPIQFVHRVIAFILVFLSSFILYDSLSNSHNQIYRNSVFMVLGVLLIQFLLGVITLVYVVPLSTALLHQLCGCILFLISVRHLWIVNKFLK